MDSQSWTIPGCSQCLVQNTDKKFTSEGQLQAFEEEKANEPLYRCYDCGWQYHESCHSPRLTPDVLEELGGKDGFICHTCVFMRIVNIINDEKEAIYDLNGQQYCEKLMKKHGKLFNVFERVKRCLPYSIDDLVWKDNHVSNEQNSFCYCGGPGKWHNCMFQCGNCRQWFHEFCVRASVVVGATLAGKPPDTVPELLIHDSFYNFTCSRCSESGEEIIERAPCHWPEIIQICLLNLSDGRPKLYFKNHIIPWLKKHVKSFVLTVKEPPIPKTDDEWFDLVNNTVRLYQGRYLTNQSNVAASKWCQLKTRSMNPRRLPETKSQRLKKLSKRSGDGDNDSNISTKAIKTVDGRTEKVLKKMAGVANMLTADPFQRLMPSLHCAEKRSSLPIKPNGLSYFNFGFGDYAMFKPLQIDVTSQASTGPLSNVSSTSSGLVGAKKRKAYRPLPCVSSVSRYSGASDGMSTASRSSVSPMNM